MNGHALIQAGICGFETTVVATSDDDCTVQFEVQTQCAKVAGFADALKQSGRIDAYQEINAAGKSTILETARVSLKGCCAGCVVPVGFFKCMQVAAGLCAAK